MAALRAQGYAGLRITCPGCRWIVITWWGLLRVPDDARLTEIVPRLHHRCGARPGPADVRPYRQGEEQPRMFAAEPSQPP
ncbi:MAG TPA: hypothetical protein VM434_05025 [Beijerinckiaceae bacterium]|nr:hypothetical protein [Beijerinckiaceae bacterium]